MELQLDATITLFIDLLDQLNMFRANICPSSGAQELVPYLLYLSYCNLIQLNFYFVDVYLLIFSVKYFN
jgi:hypothetical protein